MLFPPECTSRLTAKRNNKMQAYCMKCKLNTDMKNPVEVTMKNGKPATSGTCSICDTKTFKIGTAKPKSWVQDLGLVVFSLLLTYRVDIWKKRSFSFFKFSNFPECNCREKVEGAIGIGVIGGWERLRPRYSFQNCTDTLFLRTVSS